jgi:nondiscriminating aspartyl-tRNA synthetase
MEYIDLKINKDFDEFETLYARFLSKSVPDGDTVKVKACIHRIRIMSDFSFVILRTARRLLQCVYAPEFSKFDINALKEGDYVDAIGIAKKEERSRIGYDVQLVSYKLLSTPADVPPFVLNKKKLDVGMDTKLDFRPISLRNPAEKAVFQIEDAVLAGFRKFFNANGFTEFIAPKFTSAGAEGGADMFKVDYFGKVAYLDQSPQKYKQMMVGVFERVFSVGTVFRAEKHRTSRHINEFTGIDMEIGYIDSFYDIMDAESRALQCMFSYVNEHCADELELLGVGQLPVFDKVPVFKFADIKEIVAKKYKREFRSPNDLEPEEEKLIGDYVKKEYGSELVFLTHYPTVKRPFYTYDDPEDPNVTLSFDILLNGSEITSGGQRIHDYDMQVNKMLRLGMNPDDFKYYLMIHKYGIPPHGGLGIGLERLTMKMLKLDNIRDATLFPRDTERLEP